MVNRFLKMGFTGTQNGMTVPQYDSFWALMKFWAGLSNEYHHGDCLGSDSEFHLWLVEHHTQPIKFVLHPPSNPIKRAFCQYDGLIEIKRERYYLDRNKDIVIETDLMIATPKEEQEVLRSGTWATIRYARQLHKPTYIIYPSGEIIKNANQRIR